MCECSANNIHSSLLRLEGKYEEAFEACWKAAEIAQLDDNTSPWVSASRLRWAVYACYKVDMMTQGEIFLNPKTPILRQTDQFSGSTWKNFWL